MVKAFSDIADAFEASTVKQLLSVFEAMADGVWVCDATPKLLWVNSACEQLNDIRREDVCGRTVDELLVEGNFDTDVTRRVLRDRKSVAIIQKVRSGRTLLVNGAPVFDENGNVSHVVGSERDLTELNMLREALEEKLQLNDRISSELLALRMRDSKLKDIVANSPPMERVMEMAFRVADFDATVLLTGASGSGKSMLARVIHEGSPRSAKPFMSLNCGAIPHSLVEAELFGYVSGAFTGAQKGGKLGLIEAAHGGTLFLDEIDAFPMDMQVKLLTFLDTQNFMRVGGTKPQQADVRLICATNKDLANSVVKGLFREDLWFRLNVVPVHIPALSERRSDIPVLVRRILERLSQRHGIEIGVQREALELLCRYRFPGNVRELENILERGYILCKSGEIGISDLPGEVSATVVRSVNRHSQTLQQALADVEANYLEDACRQHKRQVDIANYLGVSQPTVARMLKRRAQPQRKQ